MRIENIPETRIHTCITVAVLKRSVYYICIYIARESQLPAIGHFLLSVPEGPVAVQNSAVTIPAIIYSLHNNITYSYHGILIYCTRIPIIPGRACVGRKLSRARGDMLAHNNIITIRVILRRYTRGSLLSFWNSDTGYCDVYDVK